MLISECVYRALTKEPRELHIVADWIDDNRRDHPEADIYCRRLRDSKNVRTQTLIDVIAKFGTRKERKTICRIVRVMMKCRKRPRPMAVVPRDLFKMSYRKRINRSIGNICPRGLSQGHYSAVHRKTVQANLRKYKTFSYTGQLNSHWYTQILVQLLQTIQPAG